MELNDERAKGRWVQNKLPLKLLGSILAEFREVDRDIVLNEHKGWKEELMQLFASLNCSILESELQEGKEERENTKKEYIASWKEEHKQMGQSPTDTWCCCII